MTHMLHRELYIMGNSGFIRREAEITNLHLDLGELEQWEAFRLTSNLFHSQLVQEGKQFLLKKGASKSVCPFVALL